jgi:hypothetical protein
MCKTFEVLCFLFGDGREFDYGGLNSLQLMVATTLVLLCTKPLHVTWAGALPWLIPVPSTAIIGREVGALLLNGKIERN